MATRLVTCALLLCDGCGRTPAAHSDGFTYPEDVTSARRDAEAFGWTADGTNDWCGQCKPEEG